MNWLEVCQNKALQDPPFKIELNEWGHITMTPASNKHGHIQVLIVFTLMQQKTAGRVLTECSVQTSQGVKVADVAWGSDDFFARHGMDTPYLQAPELCVEIRSPSNSIGEMLAKKDLYLARGAQEFWLVDEEGRLSFYSYGGEQEQSALFADFPSALAVPE